MKEGMAELKLDGVSESFNENCGKPPFDEIKSLIEMVGYEVVSIGAECKGFPGAINLQIAPKKLLEQTSFMDFQQIPQKLISSLRECAFRQPPQAKDTD